jgi:hypothetical protein
MSDPFDLFAWLKAPPMPSGAKNALIVIGPDANLTPELQQQLEQLAKLLQTKPSVKADLTDVNPDLVCESVFIGECRVYLRCMNVSI